jgi:hypothetical protein
MKTFVALAIAACMPGSLAHAAEPAHEFACDTPAGHFSYWSQTLKPGKVKVTGTLEISEKREHERWNPTMTALLVADPKRSFGLQVYSLKSQEDVWFLRITEPDTRDEEPFAMLPGDTTSIPFSLTFTKDGTLEVTAAGKTAKTKVNGFKPGKIRLSCSTGDFLFKDVTIGK